LYLRTSEQEKLREVMYIFNIIWPLDENVTDKNAVLEIILFCNLLNSFSFTDKVGLVGILYFSANIVLMKQYMDLELIKAWKIGFWI